MKEDIVRSEDYEHKNTIHPWLEKIKSWWSEKHSHGSLLQKVAVFGKILSGTSALQLEYERNVCVWGGGNRLQGCSMTFPNCNCLELKNGADDWIVIWWIYKNKKLCKIYRKLYINLVTIFMTNTNKTFHIRKIL